MTVCRRPVASHVPRGAGNRGLLWVGTHRNPRQSPPSDTNHVPNRVCAEGEAVDLGFIGPADLDCLVETGAIDLIALNE